ncbi:hypothetical protein [Niveispirillum cyanobacteriorum]|uniref:Uncharacterized protein n=1 Tax=Niveispirillum cyanobacteriorum TaxID=1612173 RepID=A0A2K9NFV1_9PROT|nr:hypothetical protein [Niveispirillum cyanobacteriorum]AUN31981.1 hypothetical protein C0V82_16255 [Niveispirillum cyanobacteriorum]GGE85198.1 hypothetical protein GCM10011317_48030 [Niveispirillum cyanobacteriorum]
MDFILDLYQHQQTQRGAVVPGDMAVCNRCPSSFMISQRLAGDGIALVDMFARGAELNRWP